MEELDLKYCSHCGELSLKKEKNKFSCTQCEFEFYQNTAAATAALLFYEDCLLMTRRAKNPEKGTLDLPGGFIDPGENAEEGLIRELQEELNISLGVDDLIYWQSFKNTYPYKGVIYETCDLIFTAELKEWPTFFQKDEIEEVVKVSLSELNLNEIGLKSIRKCVETYIFSKK